MALQGTIDAFPLTDVLQLLSSSGKSGRLLLEGDRGHQELWIDRGSVVGGSLPASDAAHMVFELLRFDDGSFTFDVSDGEPAVVLDPMPLEDCLGTAAELLSEWRRIEQVVPSLRHRVGLTPTIEGPEVTLDTRDWAVVASIGDVPEVGQLADRLGLGEFECAGALAELVQRSLVVVHEPLPTAAHAEERSVAAPPVELADPVDPEALVDSPGPSEGFPERFPIDDLLGGDEPNESAWQDEGALEGSRFAAAQTFEPLGLDDTADRAEVSDSWSDARLADRTAEAWDEVVAGAEPAVEEPWQALPADAAAAPVDDGTDEVLRQMARLSPKAAEAIAAALTTSADPGAVSSGGSATNETRGNDGPVTFMGSF